MQDIVRHIKTLLDTQYKLHNTPKELQENKPDPLFVAKTYLNQPHFPEIALLCALLSYGNAKAITKTLQKLDFSLLKDSVSLNTNSFPHYRFQTARDIQELFKIMSAIIQAGGIGSIFLNAYCNPPHALLASWNQSQNPNHARILYAIYTCIETMQKLQSFHSQGLDFILGKSHLAFLCTHHKLPPSASALKRWNMFLRWLVRKDSIDVGIWAEYIESANLILPLDTHTFALCHSLGLLKRKSYDLRSALEATDSLTRFRSKDPVAYDFALYRIGQNKIKLA